MINLIPVPIAEEFNNKLLKTERLKGNFKGTALFADLNGFTPLTEKLMNHGKKGAEILADTINEIFTPSINFVYENNGFIANFAGDAFLAVFKEDNHILNACTAAKKISEFFHINNLIETVYGEFKISINIGIDTGIINWEVIENQKQNVYFYTGNPVYGCAEAESAADENSVFLTEKLVSEIKKIKTIKYETTEKTKFCSLKEVNHFSKFKSKPKIISSEIQESFFPKFLFNQEIQAEFRYVVSCFIYFSGKEKNFDKKVSKIIDLIHEFGGYFNRISFGDKDGFILGVFGAPLAKEKIRKRALLFIQNVKEIEGFKCRAGLTEGKAFSGYTGSSERAEYTVLSTNVNLAARLMQYAVKNDLSAVCSSSIFRNARNSFDFKFAGKEKFKGSNEFESVYELTGIKKEEEKLSENKMVGREHELKKLLNLKEKITENKNGGIVYIDGTAGIGKSRLAEELKKNTDLDSVNWIYLSGDEIVKKSFYPIINFLKNFFRQKDINSIEEKKRNFEDVFTSLIENLDPKKEYAEELLKFKPFLKQSVNIEDESEIFKKIDAKGRFDNTLFAFKTFFESVINLKPSIFVLDDAQWADKDTLKMINLIFKNTENLPFFFVFISRIYDDGSYFQSGITDVDSQRILIDSFDKTMSEVFIKTKLSKEFSKDITALPEETVEFFYNRSQGNPFFLEQMLYYAIEQPLLDPELNLIKQEFEIPNDINSIIMARIDRLTFDLKEIVKTAAVLGMEFSSLVLKEILKKENIDVFLEKGEKEIIWGTVSELKYIFKHALIREAVYNMQLDSNLKKIHKEAAEAIEKLFPDSQKAYSFEIAQHYEKAFNHAKNKIEVQKLREKLIHFYEIAEKYARDNHHTFDDSKILKKLIHYEEDRLKLVKLRFYLANNENLFGNWRKALELYEINIEDAADLGEQKQLILSKTNRGHTLGDLGRYDEAVKEFNESYELCEEIDDDFGKADNLSAVGIIYSDMRQFEKAIESVNRSIEISAKINNVYLLCRNHNTLGVTYHNMMKLDKCIESYLCAYKYSDDMDIKNAKAMIANNIGNFYTEQGKLSEAEKYLLTAYETAAEIGYKSALSMIENNLGLISSKRENYGEAVKHFENRIKIDKELENNAGIALGYANIGNVFLDQDLYEKAADYFLKGIQIAERYNIKNYICLFYGAYADTLIFLNKVQEAEDYISKARKLANEIKMYSQLDIAEYLECKVLKLKDSEAALTKFINLEQKLQNPYVKVKVLKEIYSINKDQKIAEQIEKIERQIK